MKLTLPMALTYGRLIVPAIIFPLVFVPGKGAALLAVFLFALAAITDAFDGALARAWNQVSELGRILDPIADKLLIVLSLLALAADGRLHAFGLILASLIIFREIFISGLRESLATSGKIVAVQTLGKVKTIVQCVGIGLLIAEPVASWLGTLGLIVLTVATALTLWTGWTYARAGLGLGNR